MSATTFTWDPDAGEQPELSGIDSQYGYTYEPPAQDPGYQWSIPWGGSGAAVVVTGGAYAVDTDELTAFASRLRSVAQEYETAQAQANSALWEAQSTVPAGGNLIGVALSAATAGGATAIAAVSEFYADRARAVNCLTGLTSGAQSLGQQAERLRKFADDVDACVRLYQQAEEGARIGPNGARDLASFGGRIPSTSWMLNFTLSDELARNELDFRLRAVGVVVGLTDIDAINENQLQDATDMLHLLCDNAAVEDWVRQDFAQLLSLGLWAQVARTGREQATVEVALRQTAAELDPWVREHLPERVQMGSRWVDVDELTPMQRTAQYLALRAAENGQDTYGERMGVQVTLRGSGQTVTVPPGTSDPYGLGTLVPTVAGTVGMQPMRVAAPSTISQTVLYSQDLQHGRRPAGEDHQQSGTISVLRTTHGDGSHSWVVIVPGTNDWGTGDHEPQDMLTNLQAVAGIPSDMESAVVTAMREAGVQPGDSVGLYGHSQGAIVVSNIAADPGVAQNFNITSVLTAGGPTAGAQIPETVQAVHLENTGDAVPALDAAPTPTGQNRVTVTFDSHQLGWEEYPHSSQVYADLSVGLEESEPALANWSAQYSQLVGAGEEDAYTQEFLFDVTRDLGEDG